MCRCKKHVSILLILPLVLTFVLSGCGGGNKGYSDYKQPVPSSSAQSTANESEIPSPVSSPTPTPVTEVLPLHESLTFSLNNGAGNWSTSVTLNPDGSFFGDYQDVNLGESGEGYGHTVYVCEFKGQFGNVTKLSDYVYSMQILSIQQSEPTGKEDLKEDYDSFMETSFVNRYVYSDPYGFTPSYAVFELYLPGTPIEGLSSDFIQWAFHGSSPTGSTLPFYGLYNTQESLGFRS